MKEKTIDKLFKEYIYDMFDNWRSLRREKNITAIKKQFVPDYVIESLRELKL